MRSFSSIRRVSARISRRVSWTGRGALRPSAPSKTVSSASSSGAPPFSAER